MAFNNTHTLVFEFNKVSIVCITVFISEMVIVACTSFVFATFTFYYFQNLKYNIALHTN